MREYPWNLSPHVISGAVGKLNRGRRRLLHTGPEEEVPWYTLLVLESGSLVIRNDDGKVQEKTEPCVILLEPLSSWSIEIPPLSEYSWVDWGLTAEKRVLRGDDEQGAWRYADRRPQPLMKDLFGVQPPVVLLEELLPSSLQLCREVNGLWWRGGQSLLQAHCKMYQWVLEFLRTYDPEEQALHHPYPDTSAQILELIQIAERQLEQRFTTRIWAEMAGMSRSKLHQIFQGELGVSSGEVLDQIRLHRAKTSLSHGSDIARAAKDTGFQSRSSFSLWFKRKTGCSPTAWKHGQGPLQ